MSEFWLAFVSLFVAVDPVGILPAFLALTGEMSSAERRRVILMSVITALAAALAFVAAGRAFLSLMGITVADFMVAGGVLLFVIAITQLMGGRPQVQPGASEDVGVVPIGVPLIAGPAVLTTSLVLVDLRGPVPTVTALVANIVLAGLIFSAAEYLSRLLGRRGIRALSRIFGLLLAAIAVKLIRMGVTEIVRQIGSR